MGSFNSCDRRKTISTDSVDVRTSAHRHRAALSFLFSGLPQILDAQPEAAEEHRMICDGFGFMSEPAAQLRRRRIASASISKFLHTRSETQGSNWALLIWAGALICKRAALNFVTRRKTIRHGFS
jgi:hypothetical protein